MPPFWILNLIVIKNEIPVYSSCNNLYHLVYFLKHHTNPLYRTAPDMTAIDYPERLQRFELVYFLLSTQYSTRIRVKTVVDQLTSIPSLVSIYDGLN